MKRFAPSKRTLGVLLFATGILLGALLTAGLTWAGLEADFYGFQFLPADNFDGLTCPALMSTHETGVILVQINNPSNKPVDPIIRVDTSTRGVPDTKQVQLRIEPGETRQFEQPITAKNIDLDHFIFAKAYRYASYPLREANATCGVLVLDVPFLNGQQLFNIWLAVSLMLIPLGLWMWSSSLHPELSRHGISARVRSLHAHNEAARVDEVLGQLAAGEDVALVSDAGTPLLSDPGERLVAAAVTAGHAVCPVPGPSAALAALVASGLPTLPFAFAGFPPRRGGERRTFFGDLAGRRETLVLFESPRRVGATLRELAEVLGRERRACVARELTKLHESFERGTLEELAVRFAEGARGEVTLVVEGRRAAEAPGAGLEAALREALEAGKSPRDAARELAAAHGVPRRTAYALALGLRAAREP